MTFILTLKSIRERVTSLHRHIGTDTNIVYEIYINMNQELGTVSGSCGVLGYFIFE